MRLLLLVFLAFIASASALGALPIGCLGSNPEINLKVGSALVYSSSMDICSAGGTSFSFQAVFRVAPSPNAQTFTVTYTGQAVCSTADNALVISIDPDTCSQSGVSFPAFCNYAAGLYNGEFKYGVSPTGVLMIDKWSGSIYPIVFTCLDNNTCDMSLACNSTTLFQAITNVYGGSLNVTNSAVTTYNSTNTFEGNEITLENNNNITIQQSNTMNETTVTVEGDENNITFSAPDTSYYTVITNAPASCRNYAQVTGTRTTNVTINTVSYTAVTFTSSSIDSPSGDWSISSSELQYDGDNTDYAFILTACLQLGELYSPVAAGQRVLIALYNSTSTPALLGTPTSSAIFYNHTNPEFITGVCTSVPLSAVYTGNQFSIYAGLERTDASAGNAPLGVSRWTITVVPVACRGIEINFNITANFNGTQLEEGCGIDLNAPDADTLEVINTGVKSLRTNSDSKLQDCADIRLKDTTTIGWTTTGSNITADSLYSFVAGGRCFSVAQTGAQVNYTSIAICSSSSNSSYIIVNVNSDGTLFIDYVGVERIRALSDGTYLVGDVTFRDSPDGAIFWTRSGQHLIPHLNFSIVDNVTQCASCENGTLRVEKLCSQEAQCTLQADPPVSSPGPDGPPGFCMRCGSGDGDGDGGGGAAGVPIVPPLPPLIPFFPPILPPIVGAPGSGSGTPGVAAVPIPLITNCSNSNTTGGTYISKANFTEHIPCCAENTVSLDVLEIGSIPNYHYICEYTGNGSTYAWVPQAASSAATFNVTTYNQQTTMTFTNSSTIAMDSTSQFYTYGPAYFGGAATYVANLIVNGTMEVCTPVTAKIDAIESCSSGPPNFPQGLTSDDLISGTDAQFDTVGVTSITNQAGVGGPDFPNGLTTKDLSVCPSPASNPVEMRSFEHCDGVTPVSAMSGVRYPAGTAAEIQANALVDIASGGYLRWALGATATASSTSVTANGKFVLINVNARVCDTSVTNPCTITVTNSAIAVSTSVASAGIVSIGTITASAIYTVALDNILSPSLDVLFYCPTSCGPNVVFSFYVMLWN